MEFCALDAVQLARLAYKKNAQQSEAKYRAWSRDRIKDYGFPKVEYIDATDAQCFIGVGANLISIRGTDSMADVATDLFTRPVTNKILGCRVHKGGDKATDVLFNNGLLDYIKEGEPVTIVGHSLGGMVALMVAARLCRQGVVPSATVVTFGAPRGGKSNYCAVVNTLNITHHRFVNRSDGVPRVPLKIMGFHHDCPSLFFDGSGNFRKHPGLTTRFFAMMSGLKGHFGKKGIAGASDHFITSYIAGVKHNEDMDNKDLSDNYNLLSV